MRGKNIGVVIYTIGITYLYKSSVNTNIILSGEISECEEEEDKDRISRLFYLQLYSGTLDTEKYERDENYRNKIKQLYLRRRKSEVGL